MAKKPRSLRKKSFWQIGQLSCVFFKKMARCSVNVVANLHVCMTRQRGNNLRKPGYINAVSVSISAFDFYFPRCAHWHTSGVVVYCNLPEIRSASTISLHEGLNQVFPPVSPRQTKCAYILCCLSLFQLSATLMICMSEIYLLIFIDISLWCQLPQI